MAAQRKYPEEFRKRAIRLVLDAKGSAGGSRGACARIGQQLGIPSDTLRGWVQRAEIDEGVRPTQNARSTSRRNDGFPGDFISDRPVKVVTHPTGLPIDTSRIKVLRRPVESAQYRAIRYTERLADAEAVA